MNDRDLWHRRVLRPTPEYLTVLQAQAQKAHQDGGSTRLRSPASSTDQEAQEDHEDQQTHQSQGQSAAHFHSVQQLHHISQHIIPRVANQDTADARAAECTGKRNEG